MRGLVTKVGTLFFALMLVSLIVVACSSEPDPTPTLVPTEIVEPTATPPPCRSSLTKSCRKPTKR